MATNNSQGEDKTFIMTTTKGTNFGIDGLVLQMSKTKKSKLDPLVVKMGINFEQDKVWIFVQTDVGSVLKESRH